jgi:hypothetical protein
VQLDHLKVAAKFDLRVGDDEKGIQTVNCVAIFRDMVEGWYAGGVQKLNLNMTSSFFYNYSELFVCISLVIASLINLEPGANIEYLEDRLISEVLF